MDANCPLSVALTNALPCAVSPAFRGSKRVSPGTSKYQKALMAAALRRLWHQRPADCAVLLGGLSAMQLPAPSVNTTLS